MIQADLRTARQHPSYGMNGLILSAIVIAALAALAALAHVLDGLFFMRRTADAFLRFVSVWDIAMAFLGYLACAAGLSRHRIFPWLYLAFTIGFILPRAAFELQQQGVNIGMAQMIADMSFMQAFHLLQLLALLLCLSAVYVLWSPAVRITYRQRLTRDEVRLIEQLQGAEPRLSLGPRGVEQAAARAETARRQAAPVLQDGTVLARRSGRSAAMAATAEQDDQEPLPALPSFFQPGGPPPAGEARQPGTPEGAPTPGHPRREGGSAAREPLAADDRIWADPKADPDRDEQAAAALAAATVAGALKRVSGQMPGQQALHAEPAADSPAAAAPAAASAGEPRQPVETPSAAAQPSAPASVVPPPGREAATAAAIAILAASQRRSTAQGSVPDARPAPQAVPPQAQASPQRPAAQPPPVAPSPAPPPVSEDRFAQRDDAAQRQLEATAARQKLQEELEIDRRIARLRGLASGQVSALSIGLAMDRNPLAEDADEDGDGMAPGGAARSTTDERLGRLRAAAAPPRNRGDSVRRRDDQALSEELPAVVRNLAAGDPDERSQAGDPVRIGGRLSGTPDLAPRGGADASFQQRIDALLNRADATQSWQGGSLPELPAEGPQAENLAQGDDEAAALGDAGSDWPPAPAGAPAGWAASGRDPATGTGLPGTAPASAGSDSAGRGSNAPPGRAMDDPPGPEAEAWPAPEEAALPLQPEEALPAGQEEDDYPPLPKAFAMPGSGQSPAQSPALAAEAGPGFDLPPVPAGIPGLAPLPEAGEDEAAPPPAEPDPAATGSLPAPAPVDDEELARSLADILPAVPRPEPAVDPGGPAAEAGAPERPVDGTLPDPDPDPAPAPGAAPAAGETDLPAAGAQGAAAAAPDDSELAEQRIDAMRILVDEGFLSQAEFERRAAELRGGA